VTLPRRTLGASEIEVSVFALGCWRTWERIAPDAGAAVLTSARECGIDFLEAVRYDDETGRAPLGTGYSECVFGEIFRRSGWPREHVAIATKLWWEFWPAQDAAGELDASLRRTGLDHVELVYSDPPPARLAIDEVVAAVGALLSSGKARAWGMVNWSAAAILEAGSAAERLGVPQPSAVQLAYSAMTPDRVEDRAMTAALAATGASLVASYALGGGLLAGSDHGADRATPPPRRPDQTDSDRVARAEPVLARVRRLANRWDATPAAVALAFALQNPLTASVVFGATDPSHVRDNVRGAALLDSLDDEGRAALRRLADAT
jgi:aryl-alcohol dehydrogenase-like predicted oxidoreductase